MVPGGELLDRLPDRGVGDGVEPDLQPGFEPGEVRVAGGEQPVVDEELAEVFAGRPGWRRVQARVVEGGRAGAQVAQQPGDRGVAFPGVDALRPVDRDQDLDELSEARSSGVLGTGREEERGQVVAQGAAGVETAAVVLAFGAAAVAVEVGGDAGAGPAEPALAVPAREQPTLPADIALAASAHRLVEADPADPAVGPGDADLSGRPAAAVAGEPAGSPGTAAGRGTGDGSVVVQRDGESSRGLSRHGRSGRGPA